jgi:amidohydrolase
MRLRESEMNDFLDEAHDLFSYTQSLRRDFHRHPELAFEEMRTAGIVARELNELGLEVSTGIAETGVVALLEGRQPGPVVLLRFDMDALPIQEQTEAPYASQIPGVMHACGHDGHTAIGLTVARLLHAHRDQFAGTVKFVFQPAEEGLGGARLMVEAGVLENPRPDVSLAAHLWNNKPLGWLGVTEGPAMAAAETFTVTIYGKGGHGAAPHLATDPLYAAAQVISALQSVVSRNIPPLEAAVVSVTSLHAGEAFNVIPSKVKMRGTIRTFREKVRSRIRERFVQLVQGVSRSLECQAEVTLKSVTPAVVNHVQIALQVQQLARDLFPQAELETTHRTMGSEDMAYLMQDVPGCYLFIGSNNTEKGLDAPHHHPKFDFDERVLPQAAGLMAAAAFHFLQPG